MSDQSAPVVGPDGEIDVQRILVPVDGSDAAIRAVEYAVAIAAEYNASIHALYVRPGETLQGIDHDATASATLSFLDDVREICAARDVPVSCSTTYGYSTERISRHPGSVVLDVADGVGTDFVVVPRESSTETPEMLEKTAEYVLLYASQPVLSV